MTKTVVTKKKAENRKRRQLFIEGCYEDDKEIIALNRVRVQNRNGSISRFVVLYSETGSIQGYTPLFKVKLCEVSSFLSELYPKKKVFDLTLEEFLTQEILDTTKKCYKDFSKKEIERLETIQDRITSYIESEEYLDIKLDDIKLELITSEHNQNSYFEKLDVKDYYRPIQIAYDYYLEVTEYTVKDFKFTRFVNLLFLGLYLENANKK